MTFYKRIQVSLILLAMVLLAGCATPRSEFVPPTGGLFTRVKAPLTTEQKEIKITDSCGTVSSLFFYDFLFTHCSFAWDDCSVEKAAKMGGLKTVEYADYEIFTIFGFFGRTSVTAYGEKAGPSSPKSNGWSF
jgi:hypothetical protein